MRNDDFKFVLVLLFLLLVAFLMWFYKLEVGTVIAIFMASFSVISLFYVNYRNSKDILLQLNYKDMKRSSLSFKYHLQKIIEKYNKSLEELYKNEDKWVYYNHNKYIYSRMNFLMYEIEENNISNSFSNAEIEEKKEKWDNLIYNVADLKDDGTFYEYDVDKDVNYPDLLYEVVFNIRQLKNKDFHDNLPSTLQLKIEKLKDFIDSAEKEYLKSFDDRKLERDIINEINDIISYLNLQNINKIIKIDFID